MAITSGLATLTAAPLRDAKMKKKRKKMKKEQREKQTDLTEATESEKSQAKPVQPLNGANNTIKVANSSALVLQLSLLAFHYPLFFFVFIHLRDE